MSKAFTRESDDEESPRRRRPLRPALPPGTTNYITEDGAKRLRAELDRLLQQHSRTTGTSDERIQYLQESLRSAMVVPVPPRPWSEVRFGATVTVRDGGGTVSRYRIVGIDEADADQDWVSWQSPIAGALLNARVGQRVRFRVPAGEQELEIVAIAYEQSQID